MSPLLLIGALGLGAYLLVRDKKKPYLPADAIPIVDDNGASTGQHAMFRQTSGSEKFGPRYPDIYTLDDDYNPPRGVFGYRNPVTGEYEWFYPDWLPVQILDF